MITKDYRPERLHSDLSHFRNGNPFSSQYDFLSDTSICHLRKGGMGGVAPKAASNRYIYLFSICSRAQLLPASTYVYTIFIDYRG